MKLTPDYMKGIRAWGFVLAALLMACGKKIHGNIAVATSDGCLPPDQGPLCVVDLTNTNTNDFDWHNVNFELSCQEAFFSPERNVRGGFAQPWDNATYGSNLFVDNKSISELRSGQAVQMRFGPFHSCRPMRLRIATAEGEVVSEQRKVKAPSRAGIKITDSAGREIDDRSDAQKEADSYTYQWVRVR